MRKLQKFSPFSMQFYLFSINSYCSDNSFCRAVRLCRALEDYWRPDTRHCPTPMGTAVIRIASSTDETRLYGTRMYGHHWAKITLISSTLTVGIESLTPFQPLCNAGCYNFETRGHDYRGQVKVTEHGRVCRRWDGLQSTGKKRPHFYTPDKTRQVDWLISYRIG